MKAALCVIILEIMTQTTAKYAILDEVSDAVELLSLIGIITKPDCYNLWMSALDKLQVKQIEYNRYQLTRGNE